jgi:hypothetical protein
MGCEVECSIDEAGEDSALGFLYNRNSESKSRAVVRSSCDKMIKKGECANKRMRIARSGEKFGTFAKPA